MSLRISIKPMTQTRLIMSSCWSRSTPFLSCSITRCILWRLASCHSFQLRPRWCLLNMLTLRRAQCTFLLRWGLIARVTITKLLPQRCHTIVEVGAPSTCNSVVVQATTTGPSPTTQMKRKVDSEHIDVQRVRQKILKEVPHLSFFLRIETGLEAQNN